MKTTTRCWGMWVVFTAALVSLLTTQGRAVPVPGNLVQHLKADSITGLIDGNPVSSWNDSSGNSNHATQGTATEQPAFRTNMLNGLPVVEFDGVRDGSTSPDGGLEGEFLDSTTLANFATGTAFSIAVAVGTIGGGTNQPILGTDSAISAGTTYGRVNGDLRIQDDSNSSIILTAPNNLGTNQVRVLTRDASNNIDEYLAGTSSSTGSSLSGAFNVSNIGARRGSAFDVFLDGQIGEILIYSSELNSAERIITQNYLSSKYALSLTIDDYYNGDTGFDYDFDVFGVGREDAGPLGGTVTSAASGAVSLGITAGLDDGDFILAGFETNDDSTQSLFYLEATNLDADEAVTISFDLASLGLTGPAIFGLLHDASDPGSLASLGLIGSRVGDTVTFSFPVGSTLATGFYDIAPLPVPEPSSLLLLGLGMLGLVRRTRRGSNA